MSAILPPQSRGKLPRLILPGILFACLVVFLAWRFLSQSHPLPPEASVAGPPVARQLSIQKVFSYGGGTGEIGMITKKEEAPVGPQSFTVCKDGGILIADSVNARVLVYSKDGSYVRSFKVPGIVPGDVAVDGMNRVYVYDPMRSVLQQYDADGTPLSALNLNPADINTRGYFHAANNRLYFADAAARDVLLANVENAKLIAPNPATERMTDGVHGESGRIYTVSVDRAQGLQIQVTDPSGRAVTESRKVAWPGIVSARYAGEDQSRDFYVQIERIDGTGIVLEVVAFNSSGQQVSATTMPENDYALWTAKLVDVGADGTIVQFLPQQERAKLNLFAK